MAQILETYLDESATNLGGPVAVVAGLLLNFNGFAWLDVEWEKTAGGFGLSSVHMKDFGGHGRLRDFPESDRRELFTRLAKIINEHKGFSLAATVSTEQHTKYFSWLGRKGWSLYATCFLLGAIIQGKQLDYEKYPYDVRFILDDGNAFRREVEQAHGFLVNDFQKHYPCHCGKLDFDDDKKNRALQAADVIAWAVRRRASDSLFTGGFEPLLDIFEKDHLEQPFEDEWMIDISERLRLKLDHEASC